MIDRLCFDAGCLNRQGLRAIGELKVRPRGPAPAKYVVAVPDPPVNLGLLDEDAVDLGPHVSEGYELMELASKANLVKFLNRLSELDATMLKKGQPQFEFTSLSFRLGQSLAEELLSVLNEIRNELVPQHAEDRDVVNAFWDELVCEVATNPEMYRCGTSDLDNIVDEFGGSWKKPLFDFEVTYGINYLEVGRDPITMFGVEFFAPTDEALAQRGLPKVDVAGWSEAGTLTLAAVKVRAASSTIAFEAGRSQVEDAMTLLKASALRGLAQQPPADELLQWNLSGAHRVMPVVAGKTSEPTLLGYARQFGPLVIDLGDHIRHGIEGLRLNQFGDVSENIRERILRSIYWIAHSASHEADDHKFVDLCTALEILLLPEERLVRDKGNVIALRYNLLGGALNPSAVKWMYDRRNDVVHGDPLPRVGPVHTWHLRSVCFTTVCEIVGASVQKPDLLTLQDVISSVETEEKLTTFLKRAELGIYEGPFLKRLVGVAQGKLKQL